MTASIKISELHKFFSRCPDIVKLQWYGSFDQFFGRYPRSRTPKVYKIPPDELELHLKDAVILELGR